MLVHEVPKIDAFEIRTKSYCQVSANVHEIGPIFNDRFPYDISERVVPVRNRFAEIGTNRYIN